MTNTSERQPVFFDLRPGEYQPPCETERSPYETGQVERLRRSGALWLAEALAQVAEECGCPPPEVPLRSVPGGDGLFYAADLAAWDAPAPARSLAVALALGDWEAFRVDATGSCRPVPRGVWNRVVDPESDGADRPALLLTPELTRVAYSAPWWGPEGDDDAETIRVSNATQVAALGLNGIGDLLLVRKAAPPKAEPGEVLARGLERLTRNMKGSADIRAALAHAIYEVVSRGPVDWTAVGRRFVSRTQGRGKWVPSLDGKGHTFQLEKSCIQRGPASELRKRIGDALARGELPTVGIES